MMTEKMKQVQHIMVFGCGHKIIKSTFQVPERFNPTDTIEDAGAGTLCASCLTQQWEENRKQGFSIRNIFYSMLEEENRDREEDEEGDKEEQTV